MFVYFQFHRPALRRADPQRFVETARMVEAPRVWVSMFTFTLNRINSNQTC